MEGRYARPALGPGSGRVTGTTEVSILGTGTLDSPGGTRRPELAASFRPNVQSAMLCKVGRFRDLRAASGAWMWRIVASPQAPEGKAGRLISVRELHRPQPVQEVKRSAASHQFRMSVPPGSVILDANAIGRLEDVPTRERFQRSLKAADLSVWVTAINVLEALKHKNAQVRTRLLSTLRALSEKHWVLPLPSEVLKRAGRMITERATEFTHEESGFEWLLHDQTRIEATHIEQASDLLADAQRTFDNAHRKGRRVFRRFLKQQGAKDPWGSIPSFLDNQWMVGSHLDSYVESIWAQLGLPGNAPIDEVLENEAWRLYFEGTGATVYERAIVSQSPQPAHLHDVVQLVYLAGASKRILVTDDNGLSRVASAVLRGRHKQSRVMSVMELLG